MLVTVMVGLVLGFVAAIPLAGPVALLIASRAVEGRRLSALFVGFGSAAAEALYAGLAFWGFSTFLTRYDWIEPVARLLSAAILVVLGVTFARGRRPKEADLGDVAVRERGPRRRDSLLVGLTLTLINPTLIGSWAVVATALFSMDIVTFRPIRTVPFGLAVGAGIGLWYFTLVELLTRFRRRFSADLIPKLTRWLGVGFVGVGLYLAGKLVVEAL